MMTSTKDSSIRKFLLPALAIALTIIGSAASAAESPVGEWEIITDAGEEIVATLIIAEENGELSGSMTSDIGEGPIENASFADDVLTFDITIDAEGQELALAFEGTIDGDSIDVNWTSDLGEFPAVGTRGGAATPVGEWEIITDAGEEIVSTLIITEENGELTGSMTSDIGEGPIENASFADSVLSFDITIDAEGQELALAFEGTIDGDSIDVNWTSDLGEFPAVGTRGDGGPPVGEWTVVTDAGGQESEATLTIIEDGGSIAGTIASDQGTLEIGDPAFEDGVLTFDITIDAEGQQLDLSFSGTVDGDTMHVTWGSDLGDFPGVATRN